MSAKKTSLLFLLLFLSTAFTRLQAQVQKSTRELIPMGSGILETPSLARASINPANTAGLETKQDLKMEKPISKVLAALREMPTPAAPGKPVVGPGDDNSGFNGLDHFEQRNADSGNQFSIEPPDQAMGVNASQVFEAVNDAFAVYDHAGKLLAGPTSSNRFFGLSSAFTRPAGPFGPRLTDPRIIFDHDTQRWFAIVAEIDTNPSTGDVLAASRILLAVSETPDATGMFFFFSIDVTDPGFGACPCLGDQPLLGANEDGIYISTNQFSFASTSGFQ